MKRIILIVTLLLVVTVMLACSDDDSTTGPAFTVGDPADPSYQAMLAAIDNADIKAAFTRSGAATFQLLDDEFGSSPARLQPPGATPAQEGDVVLDTILSYLRTGGWHIWACSALVIDDPDTLVDIYILDSVQLLSGGVPLLEPADSVDVIRVHAHFEWAARSEPLTGTGVHRYDITTAGLAPGTDLSLSGDIVESQNADYGVFSDSCGLDMDFTVTINSIVFPVDSSGSPGECPTSGSESITVDADLFCTPGGDPLFDSLDVDGIWGVVVTILPGHVIREVYSRGSVRWTETDTCTVGDG